MVRTKSRNDVDGLFNTDPNKKPFQDMLIRHFVQIVVFFSVCLL